MVRSPKLKVFRTSTGFHDAYVAAPSRKAALMAWGSDNDLFARGAAEQVLDPALTAEPLAKPGVVLKKLRGTIDEQLAALPSGDRKRREPAAQPAGEGSRPAGKVNPADTRSRSRRNTVPRPRPSRARLDAAESAVASLEQRHAEALRALADREAELARQRQALERNQASELERAQRALDAARTSYEQALQRWRAED